jgi:hypothetical protein
MSDHPAARASNHADSYRSLRLVALAAVVIGVLLLAAAAFVLSYAGIHAIARQAGVSRSLARLYPLIFDAMLVVVGAAVLSLRGAGLLTRLYAWLTLLVLLAAAAAADALNATGTRLPHRSGAAAVAVVPWALVLIGFGMLLAMLRHARLRRAAQPPGEPSRRAVGIAAHGQARSNWQARAAGSHVLAVAPSPPTVPAAAPARAQASTPAQASALEQASTPAQASALEQASTPAQASALEQASTPAQTSALSPDIATDGSLEQAGTPARTSLPVVEASTPAPPGTSTPPGIPAPPGTSAQSASPVQPASPAQPAGPLVQPGAPVPGYGDASEERIGYRHPYLQDEAAAPDPDLAVDAEAGQDDPTSDEARDLGLSAATWIPRARDGSSAEQDDEYPAGTLSAAPTPFDVGPAQDAAPVLPADPEPPADPAPGDNPAPAAMPHFDRVQSSPTPPIESED